MKYRMNGIGRSPLLTASILILGLLLAGCDDRVTVIRDANIPIPKGSTWAWKPVAPPKDADRRPVVSRDVISLRNRRARTRRQHRNRSPAHPRGNRADTVVQGIAASQRPASCEFPRGLSRRCTAARRDRATCVPGRIPRPRLRPLWMLGIVGLEAAGSQLRKYSLPRRHGGL